MPDKIATLLTERGVPDVLDRDHPEYDAARRIWNGDIDRHPRLIVRCQGVADIGDAIAAAREHDLPLAIRGGAHNAAGFATCDDGLVVDVSRMRGIRVDPAARTAVVQTGALWREVDRETQRYGLATPGGLVSNTGVAGLTLGGGLGWLMGKFGLTIDNVEGFDLVTADGELVRVTDAEQPDLFWALRGGGGNFGVVSSIDYRLHEHGPLVYGGMIAYPLDQGRDVLRFFREFSADMPDAAECYGVVLTLPDLGPAVAVLVGYNGDPAEGAAFFEPFLKHGSPALAEAGPMPHVARQQMVDEGNVEHGRGRYWKSGYTTALSDEFLETALETGRSFTSPETALFIFRVHGAATRVADDATAFANRFAKWDLNLITQWSAGSDPAPHKDWARVRWATLESHTTGAAYINHLAADDSADKLRASFGVNYPRLAAIKGVWDPDNVFRINPNVRPAA